MQFIKLISYSDNKDKLPANILTWELIDSIPSKPAPKKSIYNNSNINFCPNFYKRISLPFNLEILNESI